MLNEARFKEFAVNYEAALGDAVRVQPDAYAYPVSEVPRVVERMMRAIRENVESVNYTGHGFRLTCKRLGIRHTKKAILNFLRGG